MSKVVKIQKWQEEARNFPVVSVKEEDLKKMTTDSIVTIAKSIMVVTQKIIDGVEVNKQLALGEIFNAASLAVKSGNKKITIQSVYEGLGIPKSSFYAQVDYYVTHTKFKKILSLGSPGTGTNFLPNYSVTSELIGEDSQDKFEFYQDIVKWNGGEEPSSKKVREYKKYLKGDDAPMPPSKPTETFGNEPDKDVGMTWVEAVAAYEKKTGINVDDMEIEVEKLRTSVTVGVDMSTDVKQYLLRMGHKEWKKMYRIVSKTLHPDLGGNDEMMGLWKALSSDIENSFALMAFVKKQQEFEAHEEAVDALAEGE